MQSLHEGAERAPVESLRGDGAKVREVGSAPTRNEQQASQRAALLFGNRERTRRRGWRAHHSAWAAAAAALRASAFGSRLLRRRAASILPAVARRTLTVSAIRRRSAAPTAHAAGAAAAAEDLVAVVGQWAEATFWAFPQQEVAGAARVAIAIEQRGIDGEEPQRRIDVEHAGERSFELVDRRRVEDAACFDQPRPRRVLRFAFEAALQLVCGFVCLLVLAEPCEPCAAARIGRDLEAHTLLRAKRLVEVGLVELLHVCVEAPVLAVDDDLHEVGLQRWHVATRDEGMDRFAQIGRVVVAVEQVELAVAVELLLGIGEVDRDRERLLLALHAEVGRVAAEAHAYARVVLAVDAHRRRQLDVGAIEVREFVEPIRLRELQEDRAHDGRVVERLVRVALHVAVRDLLWRARCCVWRVFAHWRRPAWESAASAASTAAAGATRSTHAATRLRLHECARFFAFCVVEFAALVGVKLLDELLLALGGRAALRTEARSAASRRAPRLEVRRRTARRRFLRLLRR